MSPGKKNDVYALLNPATFDGILEMDEEDNQDFSRDIVSDFLKQAKKTIAEMKDLLNKYVLLFFTFFI